PVAPAAASPMSDRASRVTNLRSAGLLPVSGDGAHPPYGLAMLMGSAVFLLYVATLAPSIAFWDSGEDTPAAHTLGIPAPRGSLLCSRVADARVLRRAPAGLSVAVRINLSGALLAAAAHAAWVLVLDGALAARREAGWLRRGAAAAGLIVGATA